MTLSAQLALDTEYDGTYDGYIETEVLLPVSTDRGRSSRLGVADITEATILVKSVDGRWYLDRSNAIAGLARGCRARLSLVTSSGTRGLFTGRISDIKPILLGGGKAWRAEVTLTDLAMDLQEVEVTGKLQEAQPIDTLIAYIATEAAWQHGSTITSDNTPENVGYAWWNRTPAWTAIEQLAAADGGTVFTKRDGSLRFHDRAWRETHAGAGTQIALSNIQQIEEQRVEVYTSANVKANRLRVRKLEPVWEYAGNIKLNPGQTKRFLVKAQHPYKDLQQPIRTANGKQDYQVYKQKADGEPDTSIKRNGSLTISVRRAGPNRIRVKVTNTHGSDKISIAKLHIRARPIKPRDPAIVRRESNVSKVIGYYTTNDANESGGEFPYDPITGRYYRRRFDVDNPWVQTTGQADRLAQYYIKRLGTPQPDLRVTLAPVKADAQAYAQAAYEIGERFTVTSSALGLSSHAYWCERVQHTITEDGHLVTTLTLSPAFFITAARSSRHVNVSEVPTGAG